MSSVAVRYRNPRHRATSVHLAALRLSAKLGLLAVASHVLGALFPKRDVDIQLGNGRWLTVPASDPYWSSILVGKDYEQGVGAIIEMALEAKPDAVLLDCGANIGYWSTAVCDRTTAIAVEAVPSTYSRRQCKQIFEHAGWFAKEERDEAVVKAKAAKGTVPSNAIRFATSTWIQTYVGP